jgi:hypothetical protein
MTGTTTNALLVFPKFNPNSFWSLQALCEIWGARFPAPPLGLITLATLLPDSLEKAEAFCNSTAWKDLAPQRDKAVKTIRRYAVEALN